MVWPARVCDWPGCRLTWVRWAKEWLAAKATAITTTPMWTIMPPLARPSRPRHPWRRVASTSWRPAEPAAKAPSPNTTRGFRPRTPRTTATTTVSTASAAGHWSRWRSSSVDALRQGSTGATAIKNSRATTIGMVMRSKYGLPTEMRWPLMASASNGKTVPSSTTKAKAAKSRLLARKAPSRDTGESMVPGDRSRSPRQAMRPTVTATTKAKNAEDGRADPRGGEGVHRIEHSRTGQEGAEDRQAERGEEQREVPQPQHAPALLHHHRVQVGGPGDPGQERRVLHRIPRPEPAPPEHLVAPPGAEDDADGEKAPGEQRPAPGLDEPALAHPPGDQAGDGEGKGDGEADEAQVEHGRVEGHERMVLQQRIRARAVGRKRPAEGVEGIGRTDHQDEEEGDHDVADQGRPADQGIAPTVAVLVDHGRDVAGQDQGPEDDGALEGRPHPGDLEQQRRCPPAVGGDVLEREVVGEQAPLHGEGGEEGTGEDEPGVAPTGPQQVGPALHQPESQGDDADDRRHQAEDDGALADRRVHRGHGMRPHGARPHGARPHGARPHGAEDGEVGMLVSDVCTRSGCWAT